MAEVRQRRAPPSAPEPDQVDNNGSTETTDEPEPPFSWSDFSTWPLSLRWSPIVPIALGLFAYIYYQQFMAKEPGLDMSTYATCAATFNYTFRINAARHQAENRASHSWEYGTAAEAVMELINPEKAVFSGDPFPNDEVPSQDLKMDQALIWVYQYIRTNNQTLFEDDYSVSDPAALGVSAVLLGKRWKNYMEAAERQKEYLLQDAPRYINGAISHRREVAEIWSDAVAMFPPFLAYYAVQKKDLALLKAAVKQVQLYRDVLMISEGRQKGLWKHIVGPSEMADEGPWSTGNAWAAYGMARVRATISGSKMGREGMEGQAQQLDAWIGEILDATIKTDDDGSGLLRNYLGQSSWFGETSGTALLAATAYRMAVLNPEKFATEKYIGWANAKREAVASRVDNDGFAPPAVNPLRHASRATVRESPEGASFLLMMGAAWRDCICKGVCNPEDQGKVAVRR